MLNLKEKVLFALMMSACMAFIMSGVMTYVHFGFYESFISKWLHSFGVAYMIAFPCVLLLAPLNRKIVDVILKKGRNQDATI